MEKLKQLISSLLTRLRNTPWYAWLLWLLAAVLAAAVCISAYRIYSRLTTSQSSRPTMQIAPPASVLTGIEKQPLPQPVIVKAYPKAVAVKKLSLPREVADDPNQEVISSCELKPSKGGYVTATILDKATGDAVTRFTEKPRPLFELGGQTELGLRYGVTNRGDQQAAVYARQDLLRISMVTVAGYGEINAGSRSQPEAKAQIDARITW